MDTSQEDIDASDCIEACVQYSRDVLSFQTPKIIEKKFDFGPYVQEMITDLFLTGVMWRYSEQFEYSTSARDRAFLCLMYYYVSNGMSERKAKKRMQEMYKISRDKNGEDTLAISIGHEYGDKEGALAEVLEQLRDAPEVAGSTHRMLRIVKASSVVLSFTGFLIALLVGRNLLESLGIGIIVGVSVLIIGSKYYYILIDR